MGFGVTELLIILAIVLVLFGAKKLRNIGGDLGGAIKNFKTAMGDEENKDDDIKKDNKDKEQHTQLNDSHSSSTGSTIEGTVEHKTKESV